MASAGRHPNLLSRDDARRIAANIAKLPRLAGPPAVLDARAKWYPPFRNGIRLQLTGRVVYT
jgi:hypothetical protein